jgi:hypothetical protein
MTPKQREQEIIALLKLSPGLVITEIVDALGFGRSTTNFSMRSIAGKAIYISGWKVDQHITVARWSAGAGVTPPKPARVATEHWRRAKAAKLLIPPKQFDMSHLKFRSVFAGGVNPWSNLEGNAA